MNYVPGLIVAAFLLVGSATDIVAQADRAAKEETLASKETDYSEFTLDEIADDFTTKMRAYSKRYRAAPTAKEKREIFKSIPNTTVYRARLIELINEEPGSNAGLKVVDWWYRRGGRNKDPDVISRLILKHYSELESIEKYVNRIRWHLPVKEAQEQLESLVEINPFDSVKATAAYELHEMFRTQAEEFEGKSAEDLKGKVEVWRDLIYDKFPEATISTGAKFVDLIEAVEFAARLEIGNSVPDIVGTDLDGVDFKLSDYDGKVRVISFWGNW